MEERKVENKIKNIFYLHIPKTGGQTLATRLSSAFPFERSSVMSLNLVYPEGVGQLKDALCTNDFVEGHVAGAVLSEIEGVDFLVTVRNPVDQILSNYMHIRRAPRSLLYSPATKMRPRSFFSSYGDFFSNFQSRYLASAFYDDGDGFCDFGRLLVSRVFDSLDRVRWCVPTEQINEFVKLWSIECFRRIPIRDIDINVAEKSDELDDIRSLIRERFDLYSTDLLLWQSVKDRFDRYRESVLDNVSGPWRADDSSRAWSRGDAGVWLGKGWWPPQGNEIFGMEWWAGPSRYSVVNFVKGEAGNFLRFSVPVVCGVGRDQILVVRKDDREPLPLWRRYVSDQVVEIWVDLRDEDDVGAVDVVVREVFSPGMLDVNSNDFARKSFASVGWGIESSLPDGVGDECVDRGN